MNLNNTLKINEVALIAAERYGLKADELHFIGKGYQNAIFDYVKDEKPYIMRISDLSKKSLSEIESELNWCLHLSKNDILLSLPTISENHNLIEVISIDDFNVAVVCFNKARGEHITYPEYLGNEKLYTKLGEITAKLHNASSLFDEQLNKRKNWYDNYYILNAKEFLPAEDKSLFLSIKNVIDEIKELPKSSQNFGLIHGDINVGNFFINNESVTLFDFDECQNSWFIEDIAIQLFYTIYVYGDFNLKARNSMANLFMKNFMSGYLKHRNIDLNELKYIPKFLKLREIIVHVGIYKNWDLNNLSGWAENYFVESEKRIKSQQPIVEYNSKWIDF